MWFVFPQLEGLGRSEIAQRYAIADLDEARAYLAHPVLGARLVTCCEALFAHAGRSATEILGSPDDLKLRSCVTLFALAAERPEHAVFRQVLDAFFDGASDAETLRSLRG